MPKFFESIRTEVQTIDNEVSTIAQDINSLSSAVAAVSTPISDITKGASLAIATAGVIQTIDNEISSLSEDMNSLSSAIATVDNEISTITEVIKKGTGTEIASNKSLVDAFGVNGTSILTHDHTDGSLMGRLNSAHIEIVILFVIPEAVGSINAHNTAIRTILETQGEVITITQADALTYPDFGSATICVLGTNNGTAWTTANLAHLKTVPSLSILCCDATSAAYMQIGTDGGNAASKTVLNAIGNIEGSILGAGLHDVTGLAVGANTIAAAGTTFSTLDMSDADITEIWYGYESVNANTDVLVGCITKAQPDGSIGIDADGLEVSKTICFYGPAYSCNDLNTLGQAVLKLMIIKIIHATTVGLAVELSGSIGDVETKLFGNMSNRHSNAVPLAAFISGNSGGTGTELPNSKSLYDVQKDLSTAIVTIDNEVSALDDKVEGLSTAIQRKPVAKDWWSAITPVLTITGTSTAKAFPEVTIPSSGGNRLPAGVVIQGAIAMVKFRKIKNTHATKDNALSHVQHLQVRDDGGGSWHNALTLPDGLLDIATATVEGGDLWIGNIDLSSSGYVDGADTYEFQIDEAHAEQTNLELRGIQSGIRVYYY
ncbi:hypothetical protein LCGC14_0545650 [marine sediment metagenome]|uniref:Uncharacterized protein n=1 Tax=marine sediment metagenome TaxID=412755 RepID=A0A0F9RRG8_9ZZZZ